MTSVLLELEPCLTLVTAQAGHLDSQILALSFLVLMGYSLNLLLLNPVGYYPVSPDHSLYCSSLLTLVWTICMHYPLTGLYICCFFSGFSSLDLACHHN